MYSEALKRHQETSLHTVNNGGSLGGIPTNKTRDTVMPLTDVAVRNAKAKATPYKLSDEKGLYLLVVTTGGKLWRMDYRFAGKRKTMALGAYPDVKLSAARDKRDEARTLLAAGVDPSENRKVQAAAKVALAANSFEVVAREWFAKMKPEWVESHSKKIMARLENDVFPWLGKRPIAELGAVEILATLKRVSDRGAKDTAKRAQENCGAVFRYAIQTGRTKYNPVPDLRGALPTAIEGHFAFACLGYVPC